MLLFMYYTNLQWSLLGRPCYTLASKSQSPGRVLDASNLQCASIVGGTLTVATMHLQNTPFEIRRLFLLFVCSFLFSACLGAFCSNAQHEQVRAARTTTYGRAQIFRNTRTTQHLTNPRVTLKKTTRDVPKHGTRHSLNCVRMINQWDEVTDLLIPQPRKTPRKCRQHPAAL